MTHSTRFSRIRAMWTESVGFAESASVFETNIKLRELASSGDLSTARKLFDQMPHRDTASYTALISAHIRSGDPTAALHLYSAFRASSSAAAGDSFILSLAIKSCASSSSFHSHGEALHSLVLKTGFQESSVFVGSALIDMYTKFNQFDDAVGMFDEMPWRNVVSWTAVINSLVHSKRYADALLKLSEMQDNCVPCDSHTYAIAAKACADGSMLAPGREIHAHVLRLGFDTTPFVANSLAAMYARCGRPRRACTVLYGIRQLDVVAWTTVMSTYVQMGREEDAVKAFVKMLESGVAPNDYAYSAVVAACTVLVRAVWGEQLHGHALKRGVAAAASVANALVTMYARTGWLTAAFTMFREISNRDIVSWSAVISAYTQEGHAENAFNLFSNMRNHGVSPNEFTLASLLSACATVAVLQPGQQVHVLAVMLGLETEAMVASGIVNMYCKCGSMEEAKQAFHELGCNDIVSWTAMINGYAEHGQSLEAIQLFDELKAKGLHPDYVCFIGVLTACCHSGLVDLGFEYFRSMQTKYAIEPGKEHYGCMVDLLGRAGRLTEAMKMIDEMPFRPDDVVWSTLLRPCQIHGDTKLGQIVAEKILARHPDCAGTHITLSNMYAAEGRWREAADARRMMREKGVRKEVGWSRVDAGDGVSVFVAGDRRHPRDAEIYDILEVVTSEAKLDGSEYGIEDVDFVSLEPAEAYLVH